MVPLVLLVASTRRLRILWMFIDFLRKPKLNKRTDDERLKALLDLVAGLWCYFYLLKLETGNLDDYLQGVLQVIERLGAITEKGRFEIRFLVWRIDLKTGLDEKEIMIKG